HVTIVHQTKDLHTADYTQLYDFLKYIQKEVDKLKAERLAKTQDPLALMANSNNPYVFPAPHQDQSSFNQNYLQQPMPNPEDIKDPTTAMNMALALMAKALKLNYSSPTNNNQRISANPRNRQIAQPGINMGQDRQMQMVGGNGGNQFKQYAGNLTGYNDVQNIRNQTQLLIAQKEKAGIQLQAEEYDLLATATDSAPVYDSDGSAKVHENCDDNEIFNMFTQEDQYTELLEPILKSHQVPQNDNNVITDVTSVEQDLNKQLSKEKSTVSFLLEEKKKLKSNFKTREDELLDKQIQLEKRIKELNNILVKMGQLIQTIHMLSPKPDTFYHTEQKMTLGYQNPFYLKQAQKKQQTLYDGKVLLEKHDPPIVQDSEETLQLAQERRKKMKQLNTEIKPANYTKINHLSGVFVPQTAKSHEELYISNISKTANVSKSISIPNDDFLDDTTPSVARKFLNKVKSTIVTLQPVVKHRMTIETHNWSSSAHQELYKSVRNESFPIVNQVDARVQNFKIQFLKEAAKFVGDFKSLANEADASLAKHKALELKIKRLLKAVVSQDIMNIVQKESVVDTSDLQTELERTKDCFENCIIKKENEYAKLWNDWYKKCDECKYDKISYDKAYKDMQQKIQWFQAQLGDLKGKSKDASCVSDTRNPLSQKLENENVELKFQVLNYARENAHLKATYKNLFDFIFVSRTQTKTIIASLQNELQSKIYKNAKLRTLLYKKVSDQKDNTHDTSENTKFAKQPIVEYPSKVVTSNSVSTPQESKGVNNDKVVAPGMFRINPFKTSREENYVPNTVSASARTKPITVSQPPVFTKKDVISDLNGKIVDSRESESQSDCSNGDNACTSNAMKPKIKRFPNSTSLAGYPDLFVVRRLRNDHVAAIMGFGDLQWGNILITRVYFVEGLGHNLFSIGQFCDSDLEVVFRRNACFVRNLKGVDLLKGDSSTNHYTINLHEMASASPICLMARASSTKSWLWHQRLSYLNFDTINDLARNDLVLGLPKFKYNKEHLCPSTMAFEQRISKPGLQSMTSGQISSGLDLTYASPTITSQQPNKGELDLLFKAMYDDYIGGQPSATARSVSATQAQQVR
nr:retrovirus-related Pol polyprotein from transposon TNT 1-94 [Tanacetum cinerariifolium]